jgi:hypothetical protein
LIREVAIVPGFRQEDAMRKLGLTGVALAALQTVPIDWKTVVEKARVS